MPSVDLPAQVRIRGDSGSSSSGVGSHRRATPKLLAHAVLQSGSVVLHLGKVSVPLTSSVGAQYPEAFARSLCSFMRDPFVRLRSSANDRKESLHAIARTSLLTMLCPTERTQ